ncbi:MAG: hypothetical protein HYX65_09475 [Gemmatimonadetes bacterium]|nr:hypothetical protein [Gemmatimonadota bacterium]
MKAQRAVPALVSFTIHVIVGGAALQWYILGYPLPDFLRRTTVEAPQQRVQFIRVGGGSRNGVTRVAQPGSRKAGKPAIEKQLVAPVEVPTGIAVAPAAPPVEAGGVEGVEKGVGAGGDAPSGVLDGMRPALADGRVYTIPRGLGGPEPLGPKQRVDSVIGERFAAYRDSIAQAHMLAAGERQPGDWTMTTKNGKKWGIDPQYIRLGNFSIPTTLLALLPLNVQGNGPQFYESRRIAGLSAEIRDQAVRLKTDDDFNTAVKRVRERKDRERAASQQLRKQRDEVPAIPAPIPVTQP